MVKIKQKKQLNLPQLIEWAWDNTELSQYKMFVKIGATMRDYVSFNNEENGVRLNGTVKPTDLFTVEVEEEITEDTVIPRLITRNTHGGYNEWTNESVNGFNLTHVEAIYIPKDDLTLTLIWTKDKGLVE